MAYQDMSKTILHTGRSRMLDGSHHMPSGVGQTLRLAPVPTPYLAASATSEADKT